MDIISFNEAATANSRIEIINANPDSTSGIVTVPKTITSGETVTIPAGRVAVLPNMVVDGDLVVEAGGEIFVPAGGTIDYTNGIKVNGESLVMSIPTAYHIYNGSVEATNTVITNGFSTTLYTGNGTTQDVITGVDMATQWGNDASEMFGGLVWLKSRSAAGSHGLFDTIRGITNSISTQDTSAQQTATSLTAFNSNGFSLNTNWNINTTTFTSWNFQTTHRRTGITNHGKAYTEHYNPFTGFTIIKYKGSGLAGHEIPHSLGRKLGFVTTKDLVVTTDWGCFNAYGSRYLNRTDANLSSVNFSLLDNSCVWTTSYDTNNRVNESYILYGWTNSYFVEDNKLIGNYEIDVYQGTGAAGNKITTRGKPAWVMIKRLDSTGDWIVFDNLRTPFGTNRLFTNSSSAEVTTTSILTGLSDGFSLNTADAFSNASGGQYLYMVVYDNDLGSGKSKYPKATDTTNLSINALVPYANGIDVNGQKVSIEYKNETITVLTLTQGKNYPYSLKDGTYGSNRYQPMYGSLRDRVIAGENPDYFDLKTMKWYETIGGEELVTNGTFDTNLTGWTIGGTTTPTWSSGTMILTVGTVNGFGYQNISTVIGKKYRIEYNVSITGGAALQVYLSTTKDNSKFIKSSAVSTSKDTVEFVAESTVSPINFMTAASAGTAILDNISVFEVEPTIGAEITPRTYLDCVVYADTNGQVSYVEELPKTQYFDRIETLDNNRKVIYLADRGISAIQNNKRYVLKNPFGNENYMDCDTKLEIYDSGVNKWIELGEPYTGDASQTGYYGAKCSSTIDGLIIQTALSYLCVNIPIASLLPYTTSSALSSAPARVTIQYNGKTGRVK